MKSMIFLLSEKIARLHKPVILATGVAHLEDIERALRGMPGRRERGRHAFKVCLLLSHSL